MPLLFVCFNKIEKQTKAKQSKGFILLFENNVAYFVIVDHLHEEKKKYNMSGILFSFKNVL